MPQSASSNSRSRSTSRRRKDRRTRNSPSPRYRDRTQKQKQERNSREREVRQQLSDFRNHFRFENLKVRRGNQKDFKEELERYLSQKYGPVEHLTRERETDDLTLLIGFRYDSDAIRLLKDGTISIGKEKTKVVARATTVFQNFLATQKGKESSKDNYRQEKEVSKPERESYKQQKDSYKERDGYKQEKDSYKERRSYDKENSRRDKDNQKYERDHHKDKDRKQKPKKDRSSSESPPKRKRERSVSSSSSSSSSRGRDKHRDNRAKRDRPREGETKVWAFGLTSTIKGKEVQAYLEGGIFKVKVGSWRWVRVLGSNCEYMELFLEGQVRNVLESQTFQLGGCPFIVTQAQQQNSKDVVRSILKDFQFKVTLGEKISPYYLYRALSEGFQIVQLVSCLPLVDDRSDAFIVTVTGRLKARQLRRVGRIGPIGVEETRGQLVYRPTKSSRLRSDWNS